VKEGGSAALENHYQLQLLIQSPAVNTMAPETKLEAHHVDGPMLPHLNHFVSPNSSQVDEILPRATTSLVPILTPPIESESGGSDDNNQYLLVPNTQRIVVRSAHHGKRVCDLIPVVKNVDIRAVALAWLPIHRDQKEDDEEEEDDDDDDDDSTDSVADGEGGEWIILAGCQNGMVHEWSLAALSGASDSANGPSPRRSFELTCETTKNLDLIHLTSASADEDNSKRLSSNGAILYGLANGKEAGSKKDSTWLVRCQIPLFVPSKEGKTKKNIPLCVKPLVAVKTVFSKQFEEEVSQNNHVCLKTDDCIFGLMAAYRPSLKSNANDRMDYMLDSGKANVISDGDVFVVMSASHGIAIYRDSIESHEVDTVDAPNALVHFAKSMKSSHYYSKEQSAFSSMAISPGTKDLALGRANGHIEVLDNVFENVANYLTALGRKSMDAGGLEHPEKVTIRRTVHWHAHPVRALAFSSAYGRQKGSMNDATFANPTNLLSGGEESVVVTWQLDRNFHKPSNFIARVGQGGIVHMLSCEYSGKIIVFCADNSIQSYNGSNYDRDWAEQGLASMALHQGDGKQYGGPSKGPIIMVKDPITDYPMLTNLPGAPGMVHWYDPKSASVVGTLEVAPFNRVSRRDPLSDPHVPAPTVKHMAVGQDGKDMVTVDTVWTENTSVGSAYDLSGPQGGITPMNVCTSIKFWSYAETSKGGKPDRRKRRNGDVPMSYECVSSMAAPHGREGEVCALAIAPNGNVACTLSKEEDAFRVWVKNANVSDAGAASSTWRCLYKVKTPSGYANLLSQGDSPSLSQKLVTFSSDGTVLSVSYGPYVTLWDHATATLLTSLALKDEGSESIQTVDFLTKDDDVILLTTANRIGVRSPFGGAKSCYLGNDEWSCDAESFGKEGVVSAIVPLPDFGGKSGATGGFFAVSVTMSNGTKSTVSIISRDGGNVVCAEGTKKKLQWLVNGEVQSLSVDKCDSSSVQLLAVTKESEMISLSCGSDGHVRKGQAASSVEVQLTRPQAPVLKVGSEAADAQPSLKRRKVSIGMSRGAESSSTFSGFDFPALSGKFTSAFIAKSLGR